jgi:hypothetical protein
MIRMVADVELLANDRRDAPGGPDLPDKTEGLGAPDEQTGKLGELLSAQPGRRPGWRLAVQGFDASLARPLQPLADRALANAQGLGDGLTHPAPLMECPRPQPALFAPVPGRAWFRCLHGPGVPQLCPGLLLHAGVSKTGRLDEGLTLVGNTLAAVERSSLHAHRAELWRLRGEFILRSPRHPIHDAETCFRKAIDIARHQQAKSLELRATTSLSRLGHTQDQKAAPRRLLTSIYGWFTEGAATRDLKAARTLLNELSR